MHYDDLHAPLQKVSRVGDSWTLDNFNPGSFPLSTNIGNPSLTRISLDLLYSGTWFKLTQIRHVNTEKQNRVKENFTVPLSGRYRTYVWYINFVDVHDMVLQAFRVTAFAQQVQKINLRPFILFIS